MHDVWTLLHIFLEHLKASLDLYGFVLVCFFKTGLVYTALAILEITRLGWT